MSLFVVYGLVDPRSGHLRYVGKTTVGAKRLREHLRPCVLKLKTHLSNWVASLVAAGLQPDFVVLEEHPGDEPALFAAEQFFIAYFSSLGCGLTNATEGGEGPRGRTDSPATRAKKSAALKGRTVSDATRLKIQAALRGRVVPLEQKQRMSAGRRGLKLSVAHRAAISVAQQGNSFGKGYKHTPAARAAISRSLVGNRRAAFENEGERLNERDGHDR